MAEIQTPVRDATRALTQQLRTASSTIFATSWAMTKGIAQSIRQTTRVALKAIKGAYLSVVEVVAELIYFLGAFAGPIVGGLVYWRFHYMPALVLAGAWLAFIGVALLTYRKKMPAVEVKSRPKWVSLVGHLTVIAGAVTGPVVYAVRHPHLLHRI